MHGDVMKVTERSKMRALIEDHALYRARFSISTSCSDGSCS